jgi:hypothetical protein
MGESKYDIDFVNYYSDIGSNEYYSSDKKNSLNLYLILKFFKKNILCFTFCKIIFGFTFIFLPFIFYIYTHDINDLNKSYIDYNKCLKNICISVIVFGVYILGLMMIKIMQFFKYRK